MNWLAQLFAGLWLGTTYLYARERQYRVDVLTDLSQLMHEYDVQRDELRRSLGYDAIEDRFEGR